MHFFPLKAAFIIMIVIIIIIIIIIIMIIIIIYHEKTHSKIDINGNWNWVCFVTGL